MNTATLEGVERVQPEAAPQLSPTEAMDSTDHTIERAEPTRDEAAHDSRIRSFDDLCRWVTSKAQAFGAETQVRRWGLRVGALGALGLGATLVSVTTQATRAFAHTKYGVDLGLAPDAHHDSAAFMQANVDAATPTVHVEVPDQAANVLQNHTNASNTDLGVHVYGGVVVDDKDYVGPIRTVDPWSETRDCVWNWGKQDLAKAAHDAGLSDRQTYDITHNNALVNRMKENYFQNHTEIANDPNHWLYDGDHINTTRDRAYAHEIVYEVHPETRPVIPPIDDLPPNPPIKVEVDAQNWWERNVVAWWEHTALGQLTEAIGNWWDRYIDAPYEQFAAWSRQHWLTATAVLGSLLAVGIYRERLRIEMEEHEPLYNRRDAWAAPARPRPSWLQPQWWQSRFRRPATTRTGQHRVVREEVITPGA